MVEGGFSFENEKEIDERLVEKNEAGPRIVRRTAASSASRKRRPLGAGSQYLVAGRNHAAAIARITPSSNQQVSCSKSVLTAKSAAFCRCFPDKEDECARRESNFRQPDSKVCCRLDLLIISITCVGQLTSNEVKIRCLWQLWISAQQPSKVTYRRNLPAETDECEM